MSRPVAVIVTSNPMNAESETNASGNTLLRSNRKPNGTATQKPTSLRVTLLRFNRFLRASTGMSARSARNDARPASRRWKSAGCQQAGSAVHQAVAHSLCAKYLSQETPRNNLTGSIALCRSPPKTIIVADDTPCAAHGVGGPHHHRPQPRRFHRFTGGTAC